MAECYVRGNTIKYLRLPDEVGGRTHGAGAAPRGSWGNREKGGGTGCRTRWVAACISTETTSAGVSSLGGDEPGEMGAMGGWGQWGDGGMDGLGMSPAGLGSRLYWVCLVRQGQGATPVSRLAFIMPHGSWQAPIILGRWLLGQCMHRFCASVASTPTSCAPPPASHLPLLEYQGAIQPTAAGAYSCQGFLIRVCPGATWMKDVPRTDPCPPFHASPCTPTHPFPPHHWHPAGHRQGAGRERQARR
eukprot:jgi/Mesvir1/10483/Mv26181-RA.1